LGTWSLATNGGVNIYIGAHEGATGGYDLPAFETSPFETIDEVARDRQYYIEGLAFVRSNLIGYLSLMPAKLLRLWVPESILTLRYDLLAKLPHALAWIVMIVAQLLHLVLIMLIIVALWKRRDSYLSPLAVTLWGVIVCSSFIYLFFFGGARYNYPLSPFLVILALLPWSEPRVCYAQNDG
jgi:hypothetical protein